MAAAQRLGASPMPAAVFVAASMLLVAVASSSQPAAAPGPASGGGMNSACMNALLNMSGCLTFVEKGSTAQRPDEPCCPELAGLVGTNPVCLCDLLAGAADSYGIAIDYHRALTLPGICRVSTPPVSTCTALGYHLRLGPAAAPVSGGISPARFPETAPASPPTKTSHAARRFSSSHIATLLAILPLAAAAISGML